MGPMGPMMGGGWFSGTPGWAILVALVAVIMVLGLVTLVVWRAADSRDRRGSRSPEEILRERYARGELTQTQYRVALVDLLKDRYVRGEIELEDYETRLGHLLGDQPARRHDEAVSRAAEVRATGSSATNGGRGAE